MLFGHNSDVKVGDAVYHVQTEDRGAEHPMIDTTVYCRGRVMHRLTNNYRDLLPLDAEREGTLRKRIDDQHRGIIEEIRSGALRLAPPPSPRRNPEARKPKVDGPVGAVAVKGASESGTALTVELLNPKTWLSGKEVDLRITVRHKQNGVAVAGAQIVAHIDGAAQAGQFAAQSGGDGHAQLKFEIPPLSGAEPVLIIEASQGGAKGQVKFQLRARPRVPTA
jgi:hypothetical protein